MLDYCAALERQKLKEGIRLAMAVSADANKFITDTEPFRLLKTDKVGRPWPLRPAPPPPPRLLGQGLPRNRPLAAPLRGRHMRW